MRIAALVLVGAVTVGAPVLPLHAQPRAAAPALAEDVRSVLFELGNSMGMLRGLQQQDSIITLEHWAAGTVTMGQQKFDVPEYRMSVNYAVPGMRVDFKVNTPRGPTRYVQVVSGTASWNESEPGRNPMPVQDAKGRLVMLWTTPMGVVKAATAAGANAKLSTSGGTTTLSFPLPAPASDVTATATLRRDASLVASNPAALKTLVGTYIVSVKTTGAVTAEATYAEYGDWNWDDYKSDIMLPRRMTWKGFDQTLELTTKNTNTYNPYVVMPVPPNVK